MKRFVTVLAVCLLSVTFLQAQYTRYIIEFRNKGGSPYSLNNPSAYLSPRAIERRAAYAIALDSTDLPVTPAYLDSIRAIPNVTVLNSSKWLNQVAIRTTDAASLSKIRSFPFVKNTEAIATRTAPGSGRTAPDKFGKESITPLTGTVTERMNDLLLNYGQTYNQVHIHNGEFLHDRGFQGQGMVIAVLDGGFISYKTNPAFDSIRLNGQLLGEWDFVHNNSNTDGYHTHGMNCLSTIAANRPGVMVGTSPAAAFWLLITEDVSSEFPVEEHFWVAGAEFADSTGADIISSSLGYQDFDSASFDHLYPERDGKTTMITRGANMAARKGMIVMNSAGNYGAANTQLKYVSCPADGDSVMAVGAVTTTGSIASFSSWGPNSAGKTKPNVVSVGQGTVLSNTLGDPVQGNGTSFSNPNMAGLVTCLWQAFPEYNNMKILDAVQQSASRYTNPDNRYGYGIPDMRKAFYILKADRSRRQYGSTGWFRAAPDPFDDHIDAAFVAANSGTVKLYFKNAQGQSLDSTSFTCDSLDYKEHSFTNLSGLPGGIYFVQYKSAGRDSTITLSKDVNLFTNDWIRVFPNPVEAAGLYVYFKALVNGRATLSVYTVNGQLLETTRMEIQKDNIYNTVFSDLYEKGSGVYIVKFDDGSNRRSFKIIRN